MLYLHGVSKGGTHALIKAVELLGAPAADTSMHREGYEGATTGPGSVFIYRHPRNSLVSSVRMHKEEIVTEGYLIGAMYNVYSRWMDGYLPYLSDPVVLAIRLEDLREDGGATLRQIANHIGRPYLDNAYERLPGMTYSWHEPDKWSHWQDHWTPAVDEAWSKERGPEIEKAFGYD